MKVKKGKKTKNSLSTSKRKNINRYKLAKQGLLNKEAKKKRRRENRREKRRAVFSAENEVVKDPQDEITGKEMLEMMDAGDLATLLQHSSDDGKNIKTIEKGKREFNEYKKKIIAGKEIKKCLPVLTDYGVQEKFVARSTDRQGLTLTKYKRKRKEDSTQDEDSGIGEPELSDEEEIQKFKLIEEEEEVGTAKSVTQILAERKRRLHEQKVKMGCIAMNIIQDSTQLTNLLFLLNMLKTLDPRVDITIYRYTLYTILHVFHDLIPSYRIQENTLDNRLRKQKYLTARQELDFIDYYKKFLKSLEVILQGWKEDENDKGLTMIGETVIYCMGDLVVRHPFFNYTVNLIQVLVPYLNSKHDKIRKLVLDALSHTIRNDKSFYLTVSIVQRIYKMTHRLRFRVKGEVLKVFLAIRGSDMKNIDQMHEQQRVNTNALTHKEKLVRKLAENFRQKPSRRQKKEKKKMAKINKQMESINVAEMKNVENERHSEVIQNVFGLYIHVLKRKAQSKLLSVVLEGLAKFAHLVNIEFFSDLLTLMNQFLEEELLGKRESLHCIQTVFTILSGQGEALNVDPQKFYNQFYRILMELSPAEWEANIEIVLEVLEQMLIQRRKKVSIAKVLSYAKRVTTLCLTLPHHIAIPVLAKMKKLFSVFSVTEALLDPDPEGCSGMYLPEIPDPEHANSAATACWELVMCERSFHPQVGILAKNILSAIPAREVPAVHSITDRTTRQLLGDFNQSKLNFNPEFIEPTSHLKSVKRKAAKLFFINGELDLEDFKLQSMCEKVLEEEEEEIDGNNVKLSQNINKKKCINNSSIGNVKKRLKINK